MAKDVKAVSESVQMWCLTQKLIVTRLMSFPRCGDIKAVNESVQLCRFALIAPLLVSCCLDSWCPGSHCAYLTLVILFFHRANLVCIAGGRAW